MSTAIQPVLYPEDTKLIIHLLERVTYSDESLWAEDTIRRARCLLATLEPLFAKQQRQASKEAEYAD